MAPVVNSSVMNSSVYHNSSQPRNFRGVEKIKFALPSNFQEVLQKGIENGEHQTYNNMLCIIRDSVISDSNICALIQNCQELIPLLDHRLDKLVQVILMIEWTQRSDTATGAFQNFLLDLCSAHNYHVHKVMIHLLNIFKRGSDAPWETEEPPEQLQTVFAKVHYVIEKILMLLPLSGRVLLQVAISSFPYLKQSTAELQSYVYNLLQIVRYAPNIRSEILHLVITKLTSLDSNAPRDDILNSELVADRAEDFHFPMEVDDDVPDKTESMKHPLGNTLDVLMVLLFRFLRKESLNEESQTDSEKAKNVYKEMVSIFEQVSLSTTGTCHTQFFIMYVCSLRPALGGLFLDFLWKLVDNVSLAPSIKQTAIAYIASFLARANFVPVAVLKDIMQRMADSIHKYIEDVDNVKYGIRFHAVFYSLCQALFYLVSFRHRDLINTRKNVVFLQGLNMSKMVTCHLNPLKMCAPATVSSFAAITRTYQLVYCNTIILRNSRHALPTLYMNEGTIAVEADSSPQTIEPYFPFDPYVLKRSSQFINPLYRKYQERDLYAGDETTTKKCEDDDDFLTENPSINESLFSYGTSPGFRYNH